jgi:hypothetical protein
MSIVSKLAKAGIAKKALEQAKRPENQAKAREAFAKLQAKRAGKGRPVSR